MPRRDTTTRTRGTGRTGRPHSLTPRVADLIVTTIAKGNHITTACHVAGINTATLYRWLRRADDYDYAVTHGQPHDRADRVFCDFRDRLLDARARAAMKAVDTIDRAMIGGYVIEEEPIVNDKGEVQTDQNGEVLYRRKYAQPDGRLALAFIAKAQPELWGQNPTQRFEFVGAGTGEGEEGEEVSGDSVSRLAGRVASAIAARQAERDAAAALEAGSSSEPDIVDVEFVEDEEGLG